MHGSSSGAMRSRRQCLPKNWQVLFKHVFYVRMLRRVGFFLVVAGGVLHKGKIISTVQTETPQPTYSKLAV